MRNNKNFFIVIGLISLLVLSLFCCKCYAQSKSVDSEELFLASYQKAKQLDPKALMILAAYKQGNLKGEYERGVFVYHSPLLVKKGSKWNAWQITVKKGRVDHYTQIEYGPPKSLIPDHKPHKALKMARKWILNYWWAKQKDPYLDIVLRFVEKRDDLPYSAKWIWQVMALSQEEECKVIIDAQKMRNLRAIVNNGPDPTPPPSDHFK